MAGKNRTNAYLTGCLLLLIAIIGAFGYAMHAGYIRLNQDLSYGSGDDGR